ncbi:MAG: hypothetical protein IPG96_08140 [Proteobacteria bacterium]|nr:hypothetical protein [Pseudomonadota bacterium]
MLRAADDWTGQLFIHLAVLEARHAPAEVSSQRQAAAFEGEEEIGSPHLPPPPAARARELARDVVTAATRTCWDRARLSITRRPARHLLLRDRREQPYAG